MLRPMAFCQTCGASNAEDARFCNMCGTKIAEAGEPGGPIAEDAPDSTMHGHAAGEEREEAKAKPATAKPEEPRAPEPEPAPKKSKAASREPNVWEQAPEAPQNLDISTMSLSAMGVRSPTKAWGVIIGAVLLFVGVGAAGMYFFLQQTAETPDDALAQAEEPEVEPTEPEDVEIGDLVPEGEEVPDIV